MPPENLAHILDYYGIEMTFSTTIGIPESLQSADSCRKGQSRNLAFDVTGKSQILIFRCGYLSGKQRFLDESLRLPVSGNQCVPANCCGQTCRLAGRPNHLIRSFGAQKALLRSFCPSSVTK